jgi:hypothetical protein
MPLISAWTSCFLELSTTGPNLLPWFANSDIDSGLGQTHHNSHVILPKKMPDGGQIRGVHGSSPYVCNVSRQLKGSEKERIE